MRRREMREFLAICEYLTVEEPDLAKLLSEPADRTRHLARMAGRIMLWSSVVLLLGGLLLDGPVWFGLGVVVGGLSWLPTQMVRKDSSLGGT